TIMSGLLIGILFSRTVSGFVGAHFGWRSMYWVASLLMILLCFTLFFLLPEDKNNFKGTYKSLMFSLIPLIKEQYYLKTAALTGALLFGSFTAFWTTLIFLLEDAPFHYNSQAAGLFGVVGVAGALAAPLVGRLADKKSPLFTIGFGIKASVLAYLIFFFSSHSVIGLIIGILILDIGVQSTHISNQSLIYSLVPEARSRLNTVYMFSYFVGGASGSALGAYAWSIDKWQGVCYVGLVFTILALMVHTIFNKIK
ncbi:MFS transporter, partial [bacterium]